MFCHQCGAQINDGASFCVHCGAKQQTPMQPPIPQEPIMQQPVFETTAPEQAPYQQPYYTPCPPQPETPPKKPINKKKLAISLVSVLLCLSLIAGIFVYFTYYATAERALRNGAEDTAEALEGLLYKGTNIAKVLDILDDIDDEFTVSISVPEASMSLAFSSRDEILALVAESNGMNIHIAANSEKLVFDFPELTNEAYSIPLANFGKELVNSALGAQLPAEARSILGSIDLRPFNFPSLDSLEDQEFYKEYREKAILEEVDQAIPHAKGVETVFRFHQNSDDTTDYTTDCLKYMLKPVLGNYLTTLLTYSMSMSSVPTEGSITTLYGLDEEGRLVAVYLETEGLDTVSMKTTIALTGKKNPWEQIEIYSDDELMGTLSIKQEDGGVSIYADDERVLHIDEEKLAITVDGVTQEVYYEIRNGGCYFTIEVDGERGELAILPSCDAEMPSGKIVDLFSLTEEELEALLEPFSYLLY